MTGPIRRVAAAAHRRLSVVAGVATEAALVDQPFRRPVEGHAQVLEVDDRLHRVVAHDLGGILVDEVIAALDGVEPVPLPVVLLRVAESGADATLRGTGVGAAGIELADDPDPSPRPQVLLQLQRRVQAGATGTHHDGVQFMDVQARWRGDAKRGKHRSS